MDKRDDHRRVSVGAGERFAWVIDVGTKAKQSVWQRITRKDDDDDDDDLPGPNAGATLWPALPRKNVAALA